MEEHGLEVLDLLEEIEDNTSPELKIKLKSDLYLTYVDDNLNKIKPVPNGSKFDAANKRIIIDKATEIKDRKENLPEDKKAFNLLTKIVNTIHPELQMKNEFPSDHPELGYAVPFLDLQVWIDCNEKYPNGEILHMFMRRKLKLK